MQTLRAINRFVSVGGDWLRDKERRWCHSSRFLTQLRGDTDLSSLVLVKALEFDLTGAAFFELPLPSGTFYCS